MFGAGAGLGTFPGELGFRLVQPGLGTVPQGGGGDQQAVRRSSHGLDEGLGRVEQVAEEGDVTIGTGAVAVQPQQVDVAGAFAGLRRGGAEAVQHALPGGQRVDGAAFQAAGGAFQALAGGFLQGFGLGFQPVQETGAQRG